MSDDENDDEKELVCLDDRRDDVMAKTPRRTASRRMIPFPSYWVVESVGHRFGGFVQDNVAEEAFVCTMMSNEKKSVLAL